MRKLAAVLAVAAAWPGSSALAADHKDSPTLLSDPATDLTDVYAWMNADHTRLILALDVFPGATAGAKFSDQALYVFHLKSAASYGAADAMTDTVVCSFAADQTVSCWAPGGEYVTGDASAAAGISSTSGKLKVFAGLRDDPFFFNITGFTDVVTAVEAAAGGLEFDGDRCPKLPRATAAALVGMLGHQQMGTAAAKDDFAGQNVLALVVELDAAAAAPGGKILGVWGSTNHK